MQATALKENATLTERDPRWSAVVNRDANADGKFYYAVVTTGVFCRPSCGARRARPENVRFFTHIDAAAAAGFRACKRCKPEQASTRERNCVMVAAACHRIEAAPSPISLEALARHFDVSPYHFHRTFKSVTGLTPHQYGRANRAREVREKLGASDTVVEAIYDAGYNSNSRFYEGVDDVLGMTPSAYRAGGANAKIRFAIGECSLGSILVAASERGLCTIALGDEPDGLARELQDQFPKAELLGGDAEFEQLVAKVVGFVDSPDIGLDLPLDVRGTAFQQRVWQALRATRAGDTVSYSDIARRIGAPKSARAVAQACAANVLAVAIPCHRVVRSDGAISGYRWGVQRKRALLAAESKS